VQRLGHKVVVDSNIVVKFFVLEADSDKADLLWKQCRLGSIRLVCPDLLFVEAFNVFWRKVADGELTEQEAVAQTAELLALGTFGHDPPVFEVIPTTDLLPEAFGISCRVHHPVYDVVYLALAARRRLPLLTADQEFYRKIRASYPAAVLLDDLRF